MKINLFASMITLLVASLFSSMLNAQTARVQVIHNAADAAAASVDVWLVASPLPPAILLDDFNFRTASPFVDAPAGVPITIGVAPSNSTAITDTIASFTVTLTSNETYIVVANGIVSPMGYSPATPFNLDIMAMGREAATMATNTDVLVYHGATDAPTVDVAEVGVGAGTIVDNISYSEFEGYLELATADYVLEVQNMAGTATVESYQAPLSTLMFDGAAITVLASGFLDPSMNSNGPAFGLYAATATGGPLVMLPVTPKTARVQVIHNAADLAAATVDVYLDGAILLDDFDFRTASPFVDAPAGVQIEVAVAPGNSMSVADSLKRFFYTLMPDETYVLVANGIVSPMGYSPATPFNIDVMAMGREAATMATNTDVLVYHGSTDAPTVDVAEVGVGAGTIVDNISYSEFEGYLELATADYVLEVQNMAGTATVESYQAPLSTLMLDDGAAITVLASGFLDPSMNSNGPAFGLYAATATGGPLVMLPVTPKTARVQVIHNSADAAAATVDVYLDGAILLDDFDFRTASPFVDAPAGVQIEVAVAPGNSMSVADSLKRFFYTLAQNETYILVANGIVSPMGYSPATPFNIDVMAMGREAATMATNTDVLVYHGSTDAPTVDVAEVGVGAGTIVDDISYSEFEGYLELATADYVLEVQTAAGAKVAAFDAPLSTLMLDGAAITVLASGFLDPTMNSNGAGFGLFAATAAGGALVPLPPSSNSIDDLRNTLGLSAFPNPSNGIINLQLATDFATDVSIEVMDATGRVIYTRTDSRVNSNGNISPIDLSGMNEGMYIIQVRSDNRTGTYKIHLAQ